MKQEKVAAFWAGFACIALAGYFGLRAAVDAVHKEGIRSRANSDMQAIAEAVEYYRRSHGSLPSETQFVDLPPASDSTFKDAENPEMRLLSEARPGELVDGWGRSYRYEQNGRTFRLFSLGKDGVASGDDIVYTPMK